MTVETEVEKLAREAAEKIRDSLKAGGWCVEHWPDKHYCSRGNCAECHTVLIACVFGPVIAERDKYHQDRTRCHGLLSSVWSHLCDPDDKENTPLFTNIELELEHGCEEGSCTSVCDARAERLEAERDRLQNIIDCANTPLMRDVLAERDAAQQALREAQERIRKLEMSIAVCSGSCRADPPPSPRSAEPVSEWKPTREIPGRLHFHCGVLAGSEPGGCACTCHVQESVDQSTRKA